MRAQIALLLALVLGGCQAPERQGALNPLWSAPGGEGQSFNDLPPEAKAAADKFYRAGLFGDPNKVTLAQGRATYTKSYQF